MTTTALEILTVCTQRKRNRSGVVNRSADR